MATLIQFRDGVAGIKLKIDKQAFRIGRSDDNEISIDDELVSKHHAVIEAVQDPEREDAFVYYVQDLGSTNHTFVNGDKISLYKLAHDDVIVIGMNNFRFVDDAHDDLEETTKIHKSWIPGLYYAKGKGRKKGKRKK